jgi:hypothetical protein
MRYTEIMTLPAPVLLHEDMYEPASDGWKLG